MNWESHERPDGARCGYWTATTVDVCSKCGWRRYPVSTTDEGPGMNDNELADCPVCRGLGYEVHRYGPDDNVEQLMCDVCDGAGRIAAAARIRELSSEVEHYMAKAAAARADADALAAKVERLGTELNDADELNGELLAEVERLRRWEANWAGRDAAVKAGPLEAEVERLRAAIETHRDGGGGRWRTTHRPSDVTLWAALGEKSEPSE